MKITAITDEEIRRLRRMTLVRPVKSDADRQLISDCADALDETGMVGDVGKRKARVRCIDAWNVLAAGGAS
jgi:hypothetical protein